ncbi:hypothetical protein ACQ4PT_043460 [Festuca glaucescens]
MTSNFSDDAIRRELCEYFSGDNSMAHHLNSQVGELPRSQVNADPLVLVTTSMTTQIACEDTEMEYEDLGDEESWAFIKNLITETTTSSPYWDHAEFNVADYINEAGNGISAAPNPTIISNGVLNNNYAMDDLTIMTRKYGVFPFIRKTARASIGFDGATANMCFYNYQLSHLHGQHLTGPLPQLTDVPMTLAPRKNNTLVLDIDGTLIHSSMRDEGADFSFILLRGAEECTVFVKKRPYVDAFLKKVAEIWQYLKDLTIIEANLAKVAIIDNTPEVFQLQVNNGIPINTWSSDPYDTSLPELIPFLETLSVAKDVRPLIANKFASYT